MRKFISTLLLFIFFLSAFSTNTWAESYISYTYNQTTKNNGESYDNFVSSTGVQRYIDYVIKVRESGYIAVSMTFFRGKSNNIDLYLFNGTVSSSSNSNYIKSSCTTNNTEFLYYYIPSFKKSGQDNGGDYMLYTIRVYATSGASEFKINIIYPEGNNTVYVKSGTLPKGSQINIPITSGLGDINAILSWKNATATVNDMQLTFSKNNIEIKSYVNSSSSFSDCTKTIRNTTQGSAFNVSAKALNTTQGYLFAISVPKTTNNTVRCAVPITKQVNNNYCGAACANMISLYKNKSLDSVYQSQLYNAAQKLQGTTGVPYLWAYNNTINTYCGGGYKYSNQTWTVATIKSTISASLKSGYPVQALEGGLPGSSGHYVIVTGIDDNYIYYNDPHYDNNYFGKQRVKIQTFVNAVNNNGGYLIVKS